MFAINLCRIFCLPVCSPNIRIKIKVYRTVSLYVDLYGYETASLTLTKHGLRVFGNWMLRKVFGPKRGVEKTT